MEMQTRILLASKAEQIVRVFDNSWINEPRHEKTCLRGFRPGPTQTGLYCHRSWLEVLNFVFRK